MPHPEALPGIGGVVVLHGCSGPSGLIVRSRWGNSLIVLLGGPINRAAGSPVRDAPRASCNHDQQHSPRLRPACRDLAMWPATAPAAPLVMQPTALDEAMAPIPTTLMAAARPSLGRPRKRYARPCEVHLQWLHILADPNGATKLARRYGPAHIGPHSPSVLTFAAKALAMFGEVIAGRCWRSASNVDSRRICASSPHAGRGWCCGY